MKRLFLLCLSTLIASCSTDIPVDNADPAGPSGPAGVERLGVAITGRHPFNKESFTQGLELDGEHLLVGTGQFGESRIYRSTLGGEELRSEDLPPEHFGEGLTRYQDIVWQLTWRAGIAYKRDAATLEELGTVRYPGEGWGICAAQDHLVMSDGTAQLRILDPLTFAERERITVTLAGEPVDRINELECVGEAVYANRFLTTDILRIAADGTVTALIDASDVPNNAARQANNVLNGIAHIPGTDRFLITGKRWPDLYEVRFIPQPDNS